MRTGHESFESQVLRHLDAAFNLAWWILRDQQDAEDVVQDSVMKAFKAFKDMRGDGKAWLLQIVRNDCLKHLRRKRGVTLLPFNDDLDSEACFEITADAENLALRFVDTDWVQSAVSSLPDQSREMIVLREFEEMSYAEISEIVGVPVGTVMSRLFRARSMLLQKLQAEGVTAQ